MNSIIYELRANNIKEVDIDIIMDRVKFRKGMQRKFLDLVINNLNCISLRGILQFGFKINYDCLKNYYIERRLLPKESFEDLCYLAKIDLNDLNFEYLSGNWGRIKGGKKSKRNKYS